MLRGAFDMIWQYTGQWWFDTQQPLDLDPIPATIHEMTDGYWQTVEEGDDDDNTPLPPPTGHHLPKCVECGDPNFSLNSEYCISCRIGVR